MRIHPRAIIFDYGKVLARPQSPADKEALAGILDLPVPRFFEAYWRFRVAYDVAELDPATYWITVAQSAGRQLTSSQIDELTEIDSLSWSHPAPVMPEWARDTRRAGLRTALLSNMPISVREAVDRAGWLPEFDHRTFSCDFGACKPAPEIYRDCLRGLGLAPSEVVFLDDRPANVLGAEALGMHALLFTTPGDVAGALEERFDLPVPLPVTVTVRAGDADPPPGGSH
jgi:putative hydrolase of the HAD superfamily